MDYLVNLSLLSPDPQLDARVDGRRRHHPPGAGAGAGARHQLGPRKIQCRLVERDGRLLCAPADRPVSSPQGARGWSALPATIRSPAASSGRPASTRRRAAPASATRCCWRRCSTCARSAMATASSAMSGRRHSTSAPSARPQIPNSEPGVYAGLLKQLTDHLSLCKDCHDHSPEIRVPAGNRLDAGHSSRKPRLFADADQSFRQAGRRLSPVHQRPGPRRSGRAGRRRTLVDRLSNHAEFAPPDGFVLEPNGLMDRQRAGHDATVSGIGPTAPTPPISLLPTAPRRRSR